MKNYPNPKDLAHSNGVHQIPDDYTVSDKTKDQYNKGYNQGFKDGKECTLVSIDAIEDITDRMISIISKMD